MEKKKRYEPEEDTVGSLLKEGHVLGVDGEVAGEVVVVAEGVVDVVNERLLLLIGERVARTGGGGDSVNAGHCCCCCCCCYLLGGAG